MGHPWHHHFLRPLPLNPLQMKKEMKLYAASDFLTMFNIRFYCFLTSFFIFSGHGYQYYDPTQCASDADYPGTRYTCEEVSSHSPCRTFLVYRASQQFPTIFNISGLFGISPEKLLSLNHLVSSSEVLKTGREVLVPITCSCQGQYFQANFSYLVPKNTTFSEISCGVFEGLVKSITLAEENKNIVQIGSVIHVPLKCACPDNNISRGTGDEIKYLVTYPFINGDDTLILGKKFQILAEEIWEANHLEPVPTVYPNTTVLVPLKTEPRIDFQIPDIQPPTPGFFPTFPVKKTDKTMRVMKLYIAGSVVGFSLAIATLLVCGIYVKKLRSCKTEEIQVISSPTPCSTPRSLPYSGQITRSSTNSCLSPDLLVGLKYSLQNYSVEELKKATEDFSEENMISGSVYRGVLGSNIEVMIKRIRFEDTRQVIDLHSKINHVRIAKLLGVCYGENGFSWSDLVFEHPTSGCLRDCLSTSNASNNRLRWLSRVQIAFDIATGLHYLHYFMVPPHTHMSISSRNIFLTTNWRAKLAVFGSASGSGTTKEYGSIGGWIAPEHLIDGSASEKVDIFGFGVVLLELISGKEDRDGKMFKECIGFLGGGGSEVGCFEQLRNFMDPCLKEDYSLAEALCLAVLAKACVEDDPMHRPSMDDILKVLARII